MAGRSTTEPMPKLTVNVDGGARGNPGPAANPRLNAHPRFRESQGPPLRYGDLPLSPATAAVPSTGGSSAVRGSFKKKVARRRCST